MNDTFFLKGNICHTPVKDRLDVHEGAYLLCEDGRCGGIFDAPPPALRAVPVLDYGDCLILPGMVDLHIHASQFAYRGTGMDEQLLEWLARMMRIPSERVRFQNIFTSVAMARAM